MLGGIIRATTGLFEKLSRVLIYNSYYIIIKNIIIKNHSYPLTGHNFNFGKTGCRGGNPWLGAVPPNPHKFYSLQNLNFMG